MSVYANLVSGGTGDRESLKKVLKAFTDVHPTIAEVLVGLAANGQNPEVLPGKVTFWVESTGMQCSISPKEGEICVFVTIDDPLTPWISLESALTSGRFNLRKTTKRVIAF